VKKMYDTDLRAGEPRELQEEIRSFIKSLPDVERKPDPMSEEAYFYGQSSSLCATAWMGFMYLRNKGPCGEHKAID
jgi:hypothetical protein